MIVAAGITGADKALALVGPSMRKAKKPALSVSNVHSAVISADNQVFTFNSVSFGAAAINRNIIVVAHARGGSGYISSIIESVVVDGVTAIIDAQDSTVSAQAVAVARVSLPTGTSGTVTVTITNEFFAAGISVFRVLNMETGPVGSIATLTDAVEPLSMSGVLNVQAGGVVIAGTTYATATDRCRASSAFRTFSTPSLNHTVQADAASNNATWTGVDETTDVLLRTASGPVTSLRLAAVSYR